MAQSEDSPVAMKLKKICLKTPVGEEQAAQAVLDPALGKFVYKSTFKVKDRQCQNWKLFVFENSSALRVH